MLETLDDEIELVFSCPYEFAEAEDESIELKELFISDCCVAGDCSEATAEGAGGAGQEEEGKTSAGKSCLS